MKTLKITEQTHKDLTEYIARFYRQTGLKLTLNEAIAGLLIFESKIWEEEKKNAKNNN